MRPTQSLVRNLLLVFLAVAVSSGCALAADFFDFVAPRTFQTYGYPSAVAAADFNRDGKLDVAAITDLGLSILLGDGRGAFGPPTNYSIGNHAMAIVAGDFNNDGYPDLAVVDDDGIQILLNDGNGTFHSGTTIPGAGGLNILVADFNGDGNLDLAYGGVTVLLGNGDGTFQSGITSPAGSFVGGLAVGDFNGDGKPDLAVANYYDGKNYGGTNQLNILIGKGDGTFLPPASYPTPGLSRWVAVADFNHDGKADVAISNQGRDPGSTIVNVEIFLGNGNGTMRRGKNYYVDNSGGYPVLNGFVAADFTGDGNPDLAFFDFDGLVVLSSDEKGELHKQAHYAFQPGCAGQCFAAGGFVGSGRQQLVVGIEGWRGISVLLDGADGIFSAPIVYGTAVGENLNGASQLAEGDFNGDGALDLFATHVRLKAYARDFTVTVSPGKGDGTFGSPIVTKIPTGSSEWQSTVFPAAGDFNGDGRLDAAVTVTAEGGQFNGDLRILLGKGDGSFRLGNLYKHTAGFGAMQVADFNHDGNLDIASACGDGVCILLGKGNGEFEAPVVYAIDQGALALVVGDFNHDGNLDIAAIASCSFLSNGCASVGILLGKGDGTFGSPTIYSDINGPTAIAIGDFNGDGNLDLAVVDNDTNNNGGESGGHLLLGDGKGAFRKTKQFVVGIAPISLAAADFNHDGKLDLAVGNNDNYQGPGQLVILHGNGDGTFQLRTTYAVSGPIPVIAGSFKKNGDPDLAGFTRGGVTVYLNTHSR